MIFMFCVFCHFLQNTSHWLENTGDSKSSKMIELWLTLISLTTTQSSKNLELSGLKNTIFKQFLMKIIINYTKHFI